MTAPVMVLAVNQLKEQGYEPDIVVLLQATCPLRTEKRNR
jgi:CMP-N-acetylneuraminic acid synthetase